MRFVMLSNFVSPISTASSSCRSREVICPASLWSRGPYRGSSEPRTTLAQNMKLSNNTRHLHLSLTIIDSPSLPSLNHYPLFLFLS
eukprot:30306_6